MTSDDRHLTPPAPAPAPAPEPKIELHVHLEGTVRPATLLEIARRNDVALPSDTQAGIAALYEYRDFQRFLDVWVMTTNCLRTGEDFRQVVVEYAAEAASFGAVYLEGIFSPAERAIRGVTWDEVFTGFCDGADEAFDRYGVTVRFTPDITRSFDLELACEVARHSVRYRDRGVVGVGLGGPEAKWPPRVYAKALDIATDGGLGLVPHAGEAAGPESIREALDHGAHRLRHGIRAVEDPVLLAEIAERGVVLDVCPTSNLRTRVVSSLAEHPLPRLIEGGALCSISTDDPAMFNTDLGQEYALAAELGLSTQHAYAAGLAGALCDDKTRARLSEISTYWMN